MDWVRALLGCIQIGDNNNGYYLFCIKRGPFWYCYVVIIVSAMAWERCCIIILVQRYYLYFKINNINNLKKILFNFFVKRIKIISLFSYIWLALNWYTIVFSLKYKTKVTLFTDQKPNLVLSVHLIRIVY